jgi:hypothetical protein
VAVAYDCPSTFLTLILVVHQVLFIKSLTNHLLCPNHLRLQDVIVNECPIQFIPPNRRRHNDHSIFIQDVIIPFLLVGVTSYFNVRKLTNKDDKTDRHITVTNEIFWDPTDLMISENALIIQYAKFYDIITTPERYVTAAIVSEHNNYDLYDKVLLRYGLYSTGTHRKGTISASELSKKWFVGVVTARWTLDRTT